MDVMKGLHDRGLLRGVRLSPRGVSLVEMLVVIGVIGVLAAVAIPKFVDLMGPSKVTVARNLLETLNGAIHRFNQSNYELLYAANASGSDEILVLRTMQYRDSNNPAVGSPYMRTDWSPVTSGSASDYRIMWMGNLFKLLQPGQSGTGIKVDFEGGDLGKPVAFPPGFVMAGR
jgi:prepilin-type N-terminal cleavage/methylation domain-containing protein